MTYSVSRGTKSLTSISRSVCLSRRHTPKLELQVTHQGAARNAAGIHLGPTYLFQKKNFDRQHFMVLPVTQPIVLMHWMEHKVLNQPIVWPQHYFSHHVTWLWMERALLPTRRPRMGSGAVTHSDLCVDFDATWIVCLYTQLPSFLNSFLTLLFPYASYCALAFHNGWEERNVDACVNTAVDPIYIRLYRRSTRWALPRISS